MRDDKRNITVADAKGKHAETAFEVIRQEENCAKLLLSPLTGRTHQIRAHLSAIRHPIVGDTLYGAQSSQRIMLRCCRLTFSHPETNETVDVSCSDNFAKEM